MTDPNNLTELQSVLAELKAKLDRFTAERKAAAASLEHPEWESREELAARQEYLRAALAVEQAKLPDLRLELAASIESQIASLSRELARVQEGKRTACSGECDMKFVLEAEENLELVWDSIKSTESQIEEIQSELDYEELWKN